MTYCIIKCTTQSEKEALLIAKTLVQKKLAACCSIIPKVKSVYFWNNQINEDNETLLTIKTKSNLFKEIEKEIKKLHSYKLPQIISIPILEGSKDYLNWLYDNCQDLNT